MGKNARCFGQDLMRGEYVVGGGKVSRGKGNLTYVQGDRPETDLDETSRKNLAAGRNTPAGISGRRPGGGFTIDAEKYSGGDVQAGSGASIFDPVLCELMYCWFCPPGGLVLDPFAGGSVRGIVASKLGRRYVGIELREDQVVANREQVERICNGGLMPTYHCDDARNLATHCGDVEADFVFTCPPYADLEVYSDDPRDVSTMDYSAFLEAYRQIIQLSCERLKDNRFAAIVVGDVRDKAGNYRNFTGDTVRAFCDAGLAFYNDAVLVTALGSLPIRVGKQFTAGRKLGKTHQNVLVFVKGNAKAAIQALGDVDVVLLELNHGQT